MTLTFVAALTLAGLSLEVPSEPVPAGGAVCAAARLDPPEDIVAAEVIWLERRISLDPDPGGIVAMTLPVPPSTDGEHGLVVSIRTATGRELGSAATIRIGPSPHSTASQAAVDGPQARTTPERQTIADLVSSDGSPLRLWSDGFSAPVWGPIAAGFGSGGGTHHDGVDYALRRGTSVRAPADGVVTNVTELPILGRTIVIDHGQGVRSLIAHLEVVLTAPGDAVTAGRIIGRAGATGTSDGVTLHYGLYLHGQAVDPSALEEPPDFLRRRPDAAGYARIADLRRTAAAAQPASEANALTRTTSRSPAADLGERTRGPVPLDTPAVAQLPAIATDSAMFVAALNARLRSHFPDSQIDVTLAPQRIDSETQDVEITFVDLGGVNFLHAAQTTISLAGRIASSTLDDARLTLNDPLRGATIPVLIRDARRLGAPVAPSFAIEQ